MNLQDFLCVSVWVYLFFLKLITFKRVQGLGSLIVMSAKEMQIHVCLDETVLVLRLSEFLKSPS